MSRAKLPLKPLALLLVAMALAAAPVAAKTYPGEMPGLANLSAPCDTSPAETDLRGNRTPTLTPPKTEPAFRGLFVLVLPWAADRHLIEARRRLQFALRLDEPKEPAFKLTLRF